MTNLSRLEIIALDVSGKNHLSWMLDAKLHLEESWKTQDCAKATILLRHHLHEDLKAQYLTIKSPYELWKNLKGRFDHQRTIILPRARFEWMHLRLQYLKNI
ncbi:hypothetical protein V2J09_001973 [Rumex salicifolius]